MKGDGMRVEESFNFVLNEVLNATSLYFIYYILYYALVANHRYHHDNNNNYSIKQPPTKQPAFSIHTIGWMDGYSSCKWNFLVNVHLKKHIHIYTVLLPKQHAKYMDEWINIESL